MMVSLWFVALSDEEKFFDKVTARCRPKALFDGIESCLPFKSLYLNTVVNESFAPNIHLLFQNQLRQTLLEQTPLRLSRTPESADVRLDVRLIDYDRSVRSRSSTDPGRYNALNLKLGLELSLYDRKSGNYLIEKARYPVASPSFLIRQMATQTSTRLNTKHSLTFHKLADAVIFQILSHWE